MRPALAFFSFAIIDDPSKHYEYNEYHQLDHRPENLALSGVMFGERWVRTPECAQALPTPSTDFASVHYMTMYWLSAPVEASRLEWKDLGTTALHLGRRPDLDWSTRALMAPFVPLKGYANSRVLISEEALPFRPNRGLFVTVTKLGPDLGAAERLARWYDRTRIPNMLECRGVAGAWTFVSEDAFPAHRATDHSTESASFRVHVYFLDEDPLLFAEDLTRRQEGWDLPDDGDAETPMFTSVLRTIVPWEWNWFDQS